MADGYDYHAQRWYQRTNSSPGGWWSEPYLNQTAGQVWMVTYNMPLRPAGRGADTRGMVSLDIPVSHLTEQVEVLSHLPGWQVSLVAPAGRLAVHPQADAALQRTLADYIRLEGRSDLDLPPPAVPVITDKARG